MPSVVSVTTTMTDTLLALIPTYGLWLIGGIITLGCFGIPLPTSILAMTAGGFAASGDFSLWQVLTVIFICFAVVDQISYQIGLRIGPPIVTRLKTFQRFEPTVTRAEELLTQRGPLAVFLAKGVFIPLGPYISYVAGSVRLGWLPYTISALCGAALWTITFTMLGYGFGDRVSQLSSLISNAAGFIIAGVVALIAALWLWRSWRMYKDRP